MIKDIIGKWDAHKDELKNWFATTGQSEYSDYDTIVKKIFEVVINAGCEDLYDTYDIGKMTIIDDGHYQGTRIYVIPRNTYQPSAEDYLVTDTYYGSCSGCDTLQGISSYDDGLPDEGQVGEYMTLALHLVQKLRYLAPDNDGE